MTQRQKLIVKIANTSNAELKLAIRLMCYQCQGFLVDGYADCGITTCPLYQFRLTRGNLSSQRFMDASKALKRANL